MSADTPATAADGVDYWKERVRELGEHAVLSTDHADADPAAVTARHEAVLLPVLKAQLDGSERVLLDLGCGRGRLTRALAASIAGQAIGVDPVAEQLAGAPADPSVDYRELVGERLPLADGEADVVFTCLVLGGLPDEAALVACADEVRRVLAPGGLVLLAESLSDQDPLPHWCFRTLEDYRAAFAWTDLHQVASFDDAGDAVAVLAGRG